MPPLAMQAVPSEGPAIPAGRAQSRIATSHFESCFYSGSSNLQLEFFYSAQNHCLGRIQQWRLHWRQGAHPGHGHAPPRRPRHQAPPRGRAGTPFGGQPSWAPRGVASRGCETTSYFTRFHDVFSLALPTATGMASPPAAHAGGQNLAPARTWLEPGWHTLAHTGTSWHTVAGTPHNMPPFN